MLEGKRIVLGVTGSISAYKAVFLLRLFKKAGADVKVVTTPAVSHFVGELSFSTLSGHQVFSGLWDAQWSEHVALGNWADLIVFAPTTANTLAKLANGLCDNALTAVYLAAACPVMIAPSMDADMYVHPSTRKNLETLASYGNHILPVGDGFLASGLMGKGRLLEPEEIFEAVSSFLLASENKALAGKKLMLTAGPTRESIDPVRYITNHSSGKMGYAIAAEAHKQGAEVSLISGPTQLDPPEGVNYIRVNSAEEMYQAVHRIAEEQDILIMSAAVSDYTPAEVANKKIKKAEGGWAIQMKRTKDILKSLGEKKQPHQFLVGFALETDNELANAQDKLRRKKLDLIVLNSLKDKGAGFGHDTNKVTIISRNGEAESYPLKSKTAVAADIIQKIIQHLQT